MKQSTKRNALILTALALLVLAIAIFRGRDKPATRPDPRASPTAGTGGVQSGSGDRLPAIVKTMYGQRGVTPRKIAGTVTYEGQPRRGARVSLQWSATQAGAVVPLTVVTGADGRFDFGAQAAERYTVSASSEGAALAVVEVDLRDPMGKPAPDAIELALGVCANTLVGTVSDASGGPIVGADIARQRTPGATSGADGAYRMCLPIGQHTIVVSADGYGAVVLTVDIRGQVRRDILLTPAGAITGKVVRKSDGAPLPGALVSAWPTDEGPDRASEALTYTAADGSFALGGLAAGRFTVWASTGNFKGSVVVVVVPGGAADITVAIDAFARVSGRVTMGDRPVAGATVYARSVERAIGSPIAITQLDGSFALDEVPLGTVTIAVMSYEVITPTRVTVAGEVRDVVVTVAALATISGRVQAGGKPIAGATVFSVQERVRAQTSSDGEFRIGGLQPGTYELQAERPGVGAAAAQVITVAAAEQRTDIVFDLSDQGSIEGVVEDQDGRPVREATVVWTNPTSSEARRATTDDRGQFVVDMLASGSYQASVRRYERDKSLEITGGQSSVTLGAANPRVQGVRLQVRLEKLSIAGMVVDESGDGIADVRVDVVAAPRDGAAVFYSWVRTPSTLSSEHGAFTIPDLAAGTYNVRARGADSSEAISAGVNAGATDVVLHLLAAATIDVTLVGFTATPAVDAQNARGDFKTYYAKVDGNRAVLTGLPIGDYIVTAHTPQELDAASVKVTAGARTPVTLTSHGSGVVAGTVRDFVSGAPVAGMACLMYPTVDRLLGGVPIYDMSVAPRSNAQGQFVIDPAPAGASAVYCYNSPAGMSSARAFIDLRRTERAEVELATVHLEPPGVGDLGVDFDQGYPIVVNGVRDDGPGAKAGIRTGDQLIALGGREVGQLSKGGVLTWISNQRVGARTTITVRRGTESLVVPVVIGHTVAR